MFHQVFHSAHCSITGTSFRPLHDNQHTQTPKVMEMVQRSACILRCVRLNKIIFVFPVTRPSLENHADPVSFYLKKTYKIKYYGADPKPHFCAHRPGMFLCFFLYFLFIQTRLSDTSNLCHFVPWSLQSYVPTGTPRVVPSFGSL